MQTKLEPTCQTSHWSDLPLTEQFTLQLEASIDPVFFWEHPALGNMQLWDSQKELLRRMYVLDPETQKRLKSELIFVSGRRGGKTTMAALIALYEIARLLFMKNPQIHYRLSPNSEIFCINVAPSEQQALDTVFKRAKEFLSNSPWFMCQEPYFTYNTVRFSKNITFKALGSNVSSGVGRTVKCFVADEVSSFTDSERRSPEEIYFKLGNSTSSFKPWNEDIRIAISSIAGPGDFITDLHKQAKKEEWKWAVLSWKKTWELNPELSLEVLAEERKRNPDIFDRDYGAEEGEAIKAFFTPVVIDKIKKLSSKRLNIFFPDPPNDKHERKYGYNPTLDYNRLDIKLYPNATDFFVATDPAMKNDAFGLTVGYIDTDGNIVIIGTTVFIAPKGEEIDVEDVKGIIKPIFESFPVTFYLFDIYFHMELQTMARQFSITPIKHILNLNDWIVLRNELFEGTTLLPDSEYSTRELQELQLIRGAKVDHPSSGSKDCADSICQAVSYIRRDQEESRLENTAVTTLYAATYRPSNEKPIQRHIYKVF